MDDGAVSGGPVSRPAPDGSGDEVDWEEVRRVYELTGESVASIQRRFVLTPSQLRKRREDEEWMTRPAVAQPGPLQGHRAVGEEALDLKLNRIVAIGAAMLELRLAKEGMTEANARTLRELCRAQEIRMRSTRNEKAAKAREKKNNDAGYDFRDDPEWLLAELTRRLDRISAHARQGGAGRSREGDAR
ncbi:MAG: hypothetical protein ACRED5_16155 [Propylenella sp.]